MIKKIIKSIFFSISAILCGYLAYCGIMFILHVVNIGTTYAESLPQPKIEERSGESSKIYDRQGNFLYEIHGDIRRKNVYLVDVPLFVQQAFIAAEDHDFYTHSGISIKNIISSISEDIESQDIERGASTIPMQLARNLALSNEKTAERKLKESIIAVLLTTRYSKDQILERYLNEVPVGGNLVGIATASETYFKKEVKDLTLIEGATIAALINAPSRLSPYNSSQSLRQRTEIILNQMVELQFITQTQAEEAKRDELQFSPDVETIKYPYFVMYVKQELINTYGQEKVEYGGLKVYTTIDPRLQELAETMVKVKAEYNAKKWQATDAGIVVIDPKTGQILAMQGGKDYWSSQVNIIVSKRQPGSSFKPFIYEYAFEQGYNDSTYILDTVRDFGGGYKPQNYGGGATGKWWSIRYALIQSLNIPAVATLQKIGVEPTITHLKNIGFNSLSENSSYGLSFALGSAEVTPLEMAIGASVFATGGKEVRPISILRIEKNDGNMFVNNENIKAETQIINKNSANMVNDILSDYTSKRSFYPNAWYHNYSLSDRAAAAKTGTSTGPRDCWLMGYTPNLVTIVWSGNNDGSVMKSDADGINVSAPLWHEYMEEALKPYPKESFEKPQKIILDSTHKIINAN